MSIKDNTALILLIVIMTSLVYYDSCNNSFVYDDYDFLVKNPAVRDLSPSGVAYDFAEMGAVSADRSLALDVWRPLMILSFAIDYHIWKLNPRWYHAENMLLHMANAVIVYIAFLLISGDAFLSFIAAAVFAIHPVQAEAVTWVSGRSNVLFLFFFMLAFISHVKGVRAAALALFALALMSKEMAIVLPAVLILYDIHFAPRKPIKEYAGYYIPFLLVAAAYIIARLSVLGAIAQKSEWWAGSVAGNVFVALKAVSEYIMMLVFPVGPRAEYASEFPLVISGKDIISVALTLGVAAAAYTAFRRNRLASFSMLWFFVALIPVYNIVPFKAVMAGRFLYLPMIGFASLLGMLLSSVKRASKGVFSSVLAVLAAAAVLIAYGALSISRNIEWRDEMSFYTHEAARSPDSPKAHYNLGYICAKTAAETAKSDKKLAGAYYAAAIDEFTAALALKPDSWLAYYALGNAYNDTAQYDLAIISFKKAAAIKENSDIYNNLGVAYYRKGMYDQARGSFINALRLDSGHRNASINLGNVYYAKGDHERARMMWSAAAGRKE